MMDPFPSQVVFPGKAARELRSNVVNVELLLVVGVVLGLGLVSAELEAGVVVTVLAVGVGLVDLCVLGQLAKVLEITSLVGGVLEDDVALAVLEVSEGEEDDVALVDPDLLAHLTTDLDEEKYWLARFSCVVSLAVSRCRVVERRKQRHACDVLIFRSVFLLFRGGSNVRWRDACCRQST